MEQAQVQGQQQVQKEFTDDVVWCGGKKKQKGVRSEKRHKAFCKEDRNYLDETSSVKPIVNGWHVGGIGVAATTVVSNHQAMIWLGFVKN